LLRDDFESREESFPLVGEGVDGLLIMFQRPAEKSLSGPDVDGGLGTLHSTRFRLSAGRCLLSRRAAV
jgi:hypothetical protein